MMLQKLSKLAPGVTSKLNLVADCLLVIAASAISTFGSGAWPHTVLVATVALFVWLVGARVLRHYDVWSEGLFGELALTSVLVISVAVSLQLIHQFVPTNASLRASAPSCSSPGRASGSSVPWSSRSGLEACASRKRSHHRHRPARAGHRRRHTRQRARKAGVRLPELEGRGQATALPAPVLGKFDDLEQFLKQNAIAEVYIAGNPARNGEAMQAAIRTCERFGVPFALPAYGFRLSRARPVNGTRLPRRLPALPQRRAQARADGHQAPVRHLCSAFALLDAVAACCFTAHRSSSSPRGGPSSSSKSAWACTAGTFYMLKFRSMVVNAEELKAKLLADQRADGPGLQDARTTRASRRIGRFIRKFSIDELPQLINVLRGEMSIVGPAPAAARARWRSTSRWQRRRLSVRPGLTCIWQVSGRNKIGFEEWMYLDMQYIDHWSLGQDFNLILKTVPVVLTGRGAS